MAVIRLTRVDHRLIHGQIAVFWIAQSGASRVIVIDDRSATNELMRDVLELATPPGIDLDIYTVAQAAEEWKKDQFGAGNVMVIFKSIPAANEARELGFAFNELQIGGTAPGAGRKVLDGAISLNEAEFDMLKKMTADGVEVIFQQTPQTRLFSWRDAEKRLKF